MSPSRPSVPRRARLLLSTLLVIVLSVLVGAHVPVAAAQDVTVGTGSTDSPGLEAVASALQPSPSPDPWYTLPAPDPGISPGTVLAVREARIPSYVVVPHRAWQLLVRSTDSKGRPVAVVTTVVVPLADPPTTGPRPLVSLDLPIDSLGLTCAPSWTLTHEFHADLPPVPTEMLRRGWALAITDHQGPRMAYAAGRMAGHAVLDGVRAARAFDPAALHDSPVILNGYSGGAIASGWAAQLQPTYAPELTTALVGVVAGGTPSDPALLFDTMDGQLGSGLFRSAIIGIAREYDELLPVFNHLGTWMAAVPMRDVCAQNGEKTGIITVPVAWLSAVPDVRDDPVVREVLRDNRMGGSAPTAPVLLFHGSPEIGIGDQFIPEYGARRLRDEWCAGGGHVEFLPVFGEHMIAPLTAREPTFRWMSDRFAGVPLPPGCVGAAPV